MLDPMGDSISVPASTPLRARVSDADGVTMLRIGTIDYADGSEAHLLDIVRDAHDHGSSSVELESRATDWPTRYHLDSARADGLRLLDLPVHSRVLEIGCGCGAMTRYLGETCAVVDALEPMPDRARVAAARTKDLDSVRVFVGDIHDVPSEATYDVVIVWGVLEYVGGGTADPAPYRRFLEAARELLCPGGVVVCAIENALGVKYLCGSPEDHTGRPFDSVNGYPHGTGARTFTRRALQELFLEAGLSEQRLLGAMPDYKFTRVLFDEACGLDAMGDELLLGIPSFPSPDRGNRRWPSASERETWATFTRGGLALDVANSFVLVAGAPGAQMPVWPDGRLAAFCSTRRSPRYRTIAKIDGGSTTTVTRRRLYPTAFDEPVADDAVEHRIVDVEPLLAGPLLLDEFTAASTDELPALLREWHALLTDMTATSPGMVDLLPHNIKRTPEGLRAFDQEWCVPSWSTQDIAWRGVAHTALMLAERLPVDHWPEDAAARTTGDLARWLGSMVGLDAGLDQYIRREAALVRALGVLDSHTESAAEAIIADQLERPLTDGSLARQASFATHVQELTREHEHLAAEYGLLRSRYDEHVAHAARIESELARIRSSLVWRVAERLRHLIRR